MFRLKKGQESFQVVDGPDAGRTFERDVEYHQPPVGHDHLFEPVRTNPKPAPARTKKAKENK